jgi:3',5'-cyclic AMP phosphodiesterase CpdA
MTKSGPPVTGAVLLVIALGSRWLRSTGPVRRQMVPAVAGAAAILLQSVAWILEAFGISIEPVINLALLAQIAIPIAVLSVMLRSRMARGAVADLVVDLGQNPTPARLREALANALGDPSLKVAYWAPDQDRFVDAAGEPMELPEDGAGQAVTLLERDGVPEAAIIHDAILLEDPGLIASVASAMRLAVENDRLTAEVEAQLHEVRASRARIVEAGDVERRRVERDLHDGAQQRLISLSLELQVARRALGDTGDGEMPQWQIARILPDHQPDLVIHTGDLIYPDGQREDYFRKFFLPYADLIAATPFYPCLGNHDVNTKGGSPLLETFVLPENGPAGQIERCYWFDYSDMRFVAIDSNHSYEHFRDVVAPWLDQVLTQAGPLWKVVFFHEPMYTHGKYTDAQKLIDSIGPVIDRHQVELVLSGHDHMFQRTHPMRAGQVALDGQGAVYVTTAAGGANLYQLRPQRPGYLAAYDDSQHSFTIVDVTSDWLDVRQIGEDDQPIDETHIPRRAGHTAPTSQPV